MLYIYFHKRSLIKPLTIGTDIEWIRRFEDDWLVDDYTKQIVKELDNSEVLGNKAIQSPVLDIIPPDWLSATCKNIIMMSKGTDMTFTSSFLSNTASKYLQEISSKHDIHLYMNHMFKYTENQTAILVDDNNKAVIGNDIIQDRWIRLYDRSERIWDVGWLPGQMEKLGMDII